MNNLRSTEGNGKLGITGNSGRAQGFCPKSGKGDEGHKELTTFIRFFTHKSTSNYRWTCLIISISGFFASFFFSTMTNYGISMQFSVKMEERLMGRSRDIEAKREKWTSWKYVKKVLTPTVDVNKWYKQWYAKEWFCFSGKKPQDERLYYCTYGFHPSALFHETRLCCAEYGFWAEVFYLQIHILYWIFTVIITNNYN